ncbi:MAG: hypothetical protein EA361_18045 [Bacteroidetes bacterium]|nr:MAG: hypothetical protein EA361_18045 [Bacteroidota bacterium]
MDAFLFYDQEQEIKATAKWLEEYNMKRPHDALGNVSPVAYRQKNIKTENTASALRSASAKPSIHSALGQYSTKLISK